MTIRAKMLKHPRAQHGVSLIGAVFVLGVLALIFVLGAKVLPTVVEYRSIDKLVKRAATEAKTVADAKAVFDRQASVADIDSIGGKDLDVQRSGEGVVVSFAYEKKIHLAGNVNLEIDYAGSSDRGS